MAQPHVKRGELVPILVDWETDPHSIYVVYPPNRHLSARLRAFVDWLVGLDYSRAETE